MTKLAPAESTFFHQLALDGLLSGDLPELLVPGCICRVRGEGPVPDTVLVNALLPDGQAEIIWKSGGWPEPHVVKFPAERLLLDCNHELSACRARIWLAEMTGLPAWSNGVAWAKVDDRPVWALSAVKTEGWDSETFMGWKLFGQHKGTLITPTGGHAPVRVVPGLCNELTGLQALCVACREVGREFKPEMRG